MFALVDCNNFYASCERVFRPDLMHKPIVVLSNNDGCVIARSNEAKALNIPMGAPAFKFEKQFQENNIQVFSANFALYGDMSQRVMNILSDYSPDMEIYSIDEAFLKLNLPEGTDLEAYCLEMSKKVHKCTGIPISIGVANTKALSKVANRIAKKYPKKTQNVYFIDNEEKRLKALKWLKVEDVWGIGRQYAKRLQKMNVLTAYDFCQLNDGWLRKNMTVTGLRLKNDLSGIPTLSLEDIQHKKNIATTRTFEKNYTLAEELRERVSSFAVSCAEKLRMQNSCCNTLMVFILTNHFRRDLPQYCRNIVIDLPFPTNSSIELSKFATLALGKIFKAGYAYKKAGVIVMNFTPEDQTQLNLFQNSEKKHKALMDAVDKINAAFGQQKVRLASQDLKRVWKMRQEKLSPRYTTRLSDIINIKV